jgi:formate dehydrogenase subunit gamma
MRFGGTTMNTLNSEVFELKSRESLRNRSQSVQMPGTGIDGKSQGLSPGSKILRFAKSERMLHWAIAGPFLFSFATGVVLVLFYNPDPSRPLRNLFSTLHRISGVALTVFPMLVLLTARRDVRIHIHNIKQAWTWIYDDFKWLALMGLAAISSKFVLPEQGKFNAAEKLNFMVLMSTYPLYIITGLLMWVMPLAVLSWIMHSLMALMATPLLLGHLYMALVNASTRPGLDGMISGHVDREWAKHHYRRWYRKHYEREKESPSAAGPKVQPAVIAEATNPEAFALSANGHSAVILSVPKPIILFEDRTKEFVRYRPMGVPAGLVLRGQPRMEEDRLLYELEPTRFLQLIHRFKENHGASPWFRRNDLAYSCCRFGSRQWLEHPKRKTVADTDRIYRVAEATGKIVVVSAGGGLLCTAGS